MNKFGTLAWALPAALTVSLNAVARPPDATIRNGQVSAIVSLPDAQKGYYRGTRFDWSGIISSLKYQGHEYITAWSDIGDPSVADFEYRGNQIVTGTNSTMVGIPEEFLSFPARTALGWEEAKVGGTFIKIGVGVLRKPDDKPYDHFRLYEIVRGSKWRIGKDSTSVTFTQTVNDSQSGYGYIYTKKVSLVPGKPRLTIEHTLRNTSSKPITGMVYDHNFVRWDDQPPGKDYSIRFGFDARPSESLGEAPLSFDGQSVSFTRAIGEKESMRVLPVGFGKTPEDYNFRIENKKLGIGLHITADQPLARATLWGIRAVFAIEPFINYDIAPGSEFSWRYTYEAYLLAGTAEVTQ